MHQPRFTLLDKITITTHPTVLSLSKRIAEEVIGTKLRIMKPNENLTKAELASIGSRDESIAETCSCRYTAFASALAANCGTCYGCVVRNFAFLVAGIRRNVYRYNWNYDSQIDNVAHLIRFSLDYLFDFESLPWYTVDAINENRKQDLFHRFALDNLSGLFLMKAEGRKLIPTLEKLLVLTLESTSREKLEERVSVVRERKLKPEYDNVV